MRLIKLTQNMSAMVDDADYDWLSQWKWHLHAGYASRKSNGKPIFMHRLINKTAEGLDTDHINHDRLDNRRCNLRSCTTSENGANRAKQKNNTSGFIGVSWYKSKSKWRAQVGTNGTMKTVGAYHSAQEAAIARDKYAKQIFGEFAVLNFP